ncbi:cell surface protein, partial [Lacticaseibacillus rhamnosus]
MKKQILSLTTLLIAAGISTAYPVAAADDLGPKSSVAQLTVDPG